MTVPSIISLLASLGSGVGAALYFSAARQSGSYRARIAGRIMIAVAIVAVISSAAAWPGYERLWSAILAVAICGAIAAWWIYQGPDRN